MSDEEISFSIIITRTYTISIYRINLDMKLIKV